MPVEFKLIKKTKENSNPVLKPGEAYISNLVEKDRFVKKFLWIACYLCGLEAPTLSHTLTENSDGTVTISPSLMCPKEGCPAHYYIRNSKLELT